MAWEEALIALFSFFRVISDAAARIWDALPGFIKFAVFLALIGIAGNVVSTVVGATSGSVCYHSQIYNQNLIIPVWTQLTSGLFGPSKDYIDMLNTIQSNIRKSEATNQTVRVTNEYFISDCCLSPTGVVLGTPTSCKDCPVTWWPGCPEECKCWQDNCGAAWKSSIDELLLRSHYYENCTEIVHRWDNSTSTWFLDLDCTNATQWTNTSWEADLKVKLDKDFSAYNLTSPPVVGIWCSGGCTPNLAIMGVDIFNLNYWMIGLLIYFLVFSIRWMSQSGLFDR